jgi:hypothetical protein
MFSSAQSDQQLKSTRFFPVLPVTTGSDKRSSVITENSEQLLENVGRSSTLNLKFDLLRPCTVPIFVKFKKNAEFSTGRILLHPNQYMTHTVDPSKCRNR